MEPVGEPGQPSPLGGLGAPGTFPSLSSAPLGWLGRHAASRDPMESCAVKAVMGGVMGGLMGAATGFVLGGYGSIAPPVTLPGVPEPPSIPMKWQLRENWLSTARRARKWGRNMGAVTIIFSGVECMIEKYRGRHDILNGTSAGCITGAALASKQGPVAMCFGCAGFAAFSAAMESFLGH